MNIFGILTLVGVGIVLAAIAIYLIMYLSALRRTAKVLSTVSGAVAGISGQVQPLEPVLVNVNGNLTKARNALAGVLGH
ncbi:MAG: hypothetical protein DLM59_02705 [Pseudonocardiales bacterium]|nr:MAG: hypothetical protein DLM59_02705 [Pseudonocardiales bacterium]